MTASNDCVFCKIIDGELPCKKIYEDEHTLAFLPLKPDHPDHTLVIPKFHTRNIVDCPAAILGYTMVIVQKIANDLIAKHGCVRVVVNNEPPLQEVFHLHFHIIPYNPEMKGKKMP